MLRFVLLTLLLFAFHVRDQQFQLGERRIAFGEIAAGTKNGDVVEGVAASAVDAVQGRAAAESIALVHGVVEFNSTARTTRWDVHGELVERFVEFAAFLARPPTSCVEDVPNAFGGNRQALPMPLSEVSLAFRRLPEARDRGALLGAVGWLAQPFGFSFCVGFCHATEQGLTANIHAQSSEVSAC